ncbi:hypothetical protein ACHAXT_005677 [Thalassiosira profunda]
MDVVAPLPPPPSAGALPPPPPWRSHAVDRSGEFLSAARTALRIAQQRHRQKQQQSSAPGYEQIIDGEPLPEWMAQIDPAQLQLYQSPQYPEHREDDAAALVQDSQALLRLLDSHLSELGSLVRRRGHTNDPTLEIQAVMEKFQEGAKEVKEVCDSLRLAGTRPVNVLGEKVRSSTQRRKHYELLSSKLEDQARERTEKLKKELETRGKVLRDQSHRRKLLASGGGNANQPAAPPRTVQPTRLPPQNRAALNAASQYQSPLFTATSGAGTAAKRNGGYAGYGGSAATSANKQSSGGYAGYGGTSSAPPSFSTGMRQRKQQPQPRSNIQIDSGQDDDDKYNKDDSVHQQISARREKRATRNRAQQARLAEKSIAELGTMFAKMSSLISQQGEVLERIEDDVEAAGGEIDAGHDELVKVYSMTRGNRGLILKVFGILIFLIVFMKLY